MPSWLTRLGQSPQPSAASSHPGGKAEEQLSCDPVGISQGSHSPQFACQDFKLLNCDDHAQFLKRHGKDPADYRPDIAHQALLAILDSTHVAPPEETRGAVLRRYCQHLWRVRGCDGVATFCQPDWQITNAADSRQFAHGSPPDPQWTESIWQQLRLCIYQHEPGGREQMVLLSELGPTVCSAAAAFLAGQAN
ncbi:hypothetical protein WJX74_003910 [Apatococcus lobatus]|uniref:Uncharacterized protein n=1 Tax=Apatococcus lobatus TaxID=904363 RepID=A0AAW1R226_9CHLO